MEEKNVLDVLDEIVAQRMPDVPLSATQGYKDTIKWFMLAL